MDLEVYPFQRPKLYDPFSPDNRREPIFGTIDPNAEDLRSSRGPGARTMLERSTMAGYLEEDKRVIRAQREVGAENFASLSERREYARRLSDDAAQIARSMASTSNFSGSALAALSALDKGQSAKSDQSEVVIGPARFGRIIGTDAGPTRENFYYAASTSDSWGGFSANHARLGVYVREFENALNPSESIGVGAVASSKQTGGAGNKAISAASQIGAVVNNIDAALEGLRANNLDLSRATDPEAIRLVSELMALRSNLMTVNAELGDVQSKDALKSVFQ